MSMRITNAQITAMMQGSMSMNSAQLGKLMQQMATGQRIMQPSDDPISSVRLLRLQREEASLAQFRSNIQTLSGSLSVQETNLTAASDSMLSVRDLLLWEANGTNGDDDLRAIAGELGNIEQTLVSFLNVRDEEGRYLLSGTLSNQPAVTHDGTSYSATGNAKTRQAAVANGVLIEENVTVHGIFGENMDFLNSLHGLVQALQDPLLDASDPQLKQDIETALGHLDSTHRDLLGAVAELGGRQNTLTLLDDSNTEVSLVNQKIEGELSQLDYAAASIDLNQYMLSLQATQQTYLRINQMSLFNHM